MDSISVAIGEEMRRGEKSSFIENLALPYGSYMCVLGLEDGQ
jgi:hypothetical protein